MVQNNLNFVCKGKDIDEKLKSELKKRKLVEEVTEKIFRIKKGSNFSTSIKKAPADLTAEMIQSGGWKNTKFKPYNLEALGVDVLAERLDATGEAGPVRLQVSSPGQGKVVVVELVMGMVVVVVVVVKGRSWWSRC